MFERFVWRRAEEALADHPGGSDRGTAPGWQDHACPKDGGKLADLYWPCHQIPSRRATNWLFGPSLLTTM